MNHEHDPLRDLPATPINRRRAIASLGAIGIIAASGPSAHALQGQATPATQATPAPTEAGVEVSMPDWRFSLIETHDPYAGTVTKPDVLPADVRVVACQVMLTNMSDQPMEFRVSDVRVRDANGVEYRAGDYLGTEPRLVSRPQCCKSRSPRVQTGRCGQYGAPPFLLFQELSLPCSSSCSAANVCVRW
jgi:hypothetical protein